MAPEVMCHGLSRILELRRVENCHKSAFDYPSIQLIWDETRFSRFSRSSCACYFVFYLVFFFFFFNLLIIRRCAETAASARSQPLLQLTSTLPLLAKTHRESAETVESSLSLSLLFPGVFGRRLSGVTVSDWHLATSQIHPTNWTLRSGWSTERHSNWSLANENCVLRRGKLSIYSCWSCPSWPVVGFLIKRGLLYPRPFHQGERANEGRRERERLEGKGGESELQVLLYSTYHLGIFIFLQIVQHLATKYVLKISMKS